MDNSSNSYRHLAAASLLVIIFVIFSKEISAIFTAITTNDQLYQNLFFPPIAIFFCVRQREKLRQTQSDTSPAGWLVLCFGIAVGLLARYYGKYSTAQYALVVTLTGAVWAIYGDAVARRLGMSFFFLFLTVPPPSRIIWDVLPAVTYPERVAVAWLSSKLALLVGIPTVWDGLYIHVRDFTLVVAAACSGLNYFINLVAVIALYLGISGGTRKNKACIIIAAPAISLTGNLVRVWLNVVVANAWGANTALYYFHNISALVFSAVVLLLLLILGDRLGMNNSAK